MDKEDIILSLYADYHHWCKANRITPERWEAFHNIVKDYDREDIEWVRSGYKDKSLPEPIQPNDEERAVAEVIRMLGGKR